MSFFNQDGRWLSYRNAGLDPPSPMEAPPQPPPESSVEEPIPPQSPPDNPNDTTTTLGETTISASSTKVQLSQALRGWSTASSDAEVLSLSARSNASVDSSNLLSYQSNDPPGDHQLPNSAVSNTHAPSTTESDTSNLNRRIGALVIFPTLSINVAMFPLFHNLMLS